jgi:hypothetical protein
LFTVVQILNWVDAYNETHGRWPDTQSGAIAADSKDTWGQVNMALRAGSRGLPGGSSLARLLAEHRGVLNHTSRPDLSPAKILAWADAHFATTGTWPSSSSGAVLAAGGENWYALDTALRRGNRGLPGGSSLARLLKPHRAARQVSLTVEMIQAWGQAHLAATGRWPDRHSGRVIAAPAERWSRIHSALSTGARGLPGGMTLARVFGLPVDARVCRVRRPLSVETIMKWAEVHHAATGRWPQIGSGAVASAPGENWRNINAALYIGTRGLHSGLSLARLFAGRKAAERSRPGSIDSHVNEDRGNSRGD